MCKRVWFEEEGLFLAHVQELKGGDPCRSAQCKAREAIYF